MAGYHIYGRPFAGSLIAEFLLTEVGEDYTISFPDKEERQSAAFRAFSPLGKIPALTTPDGYTICETLAIIAYKQPVTKGEIEAIRGVSSDYAVQKLLEKELIVISGRNEKLPGHPLLYATSKSFMDYFGINSPEDLPKIREVLAEQILLPTNVMEAMERSDSESANESAGPIIEETDLGAGEEN